AGSRHIDDNGGLCLVEQSLLQQRGPLRGQEFKHWLMLAARQRADKIRDTRIDRTGRPPQRGRDHDARRRVQPPENDLVLRIAGSRGGLYGCLEIFVDESEYVLRT